MSPDESKNSWGHAHGAQQRDKQRHLAPPLTSPACVPYKTLEQRHQDANLGHSLPSLLEEVGSSQGTDVVFPAPQGREVRLRRVGQPDRAQAILLQRLGLNLPQHLRLPAGNRQEREQLRWLTC